MHWSHDEAPSHRSPSHSSFRALRPSAFDPKGCQVTIANVWAEIPAETLEEGRRWYPAARDLAKRLDPSQPARGAAVIAVLSPRRSWPQNAALAEAAYGMPATDVPTMGDQRRKLARLFAGEDPFTVVGGDKVRAFHATIVNPAHPIAVIDRHAIAVVDGAPVTGDNLRITSRQYQDYSDAYALFAASVGEYVSTVQAATWIHWRRNYAVAFHGDAA